MATATRHTRQRQAVRDLLAEESAFRSAQEIHAELRAAGESVGLATVYRNLAMLVDAGELDSVLRADGETLYRRCSQVHHHHLVCRRCGLTVEVSGPAVEKWAASVAAEHGFTDVGHSVELTGVCGACSRTPDTSDDSDPDAAVKSTTYQPLASVSFDSDR